MLITTAFTGKILKQYIKDHRMEHYDILGLEGGEIEDNEMYALHPYTTPRLITISKIRHIDNVDIMRKEYPSVWRDEIESGRQI